MPCFSDLLEEKLSSGKPPLVVGMDPIPDLFPPDLLPPEGASPERWARAFVELAERTLAALSDLVVGVKFQSAFYERLGAAGLEALRESLGIARRRGLVTIADVKRGDIGSTARAYAEAYLGDLPGTPGPFTDAVTVNPYLGEDGLKPFLELAARKGKGLFVLVKTSNPSGPRFQDLKAGGKPLYLHVAELVDELGKECVGETGLSCVGAVIGATFPAVLEELRSALPRAVFLLPGVGAQGGSVADLRTAFLPGLRGALVTASRSIVYAYRRRRSDSWPEAARAEARDLAAALRAISV